MNNYTTLTFEKEILVKDIITRDWKGNTCYLAEIYADNAKNYFQNVSVSKELYDKWEKTKNLRFNCVITISAIFIKSEKRTRNRIFIDLA